MKSMLSNLFSGFYSALIDNSDNSANDRRRHLLYTCFTGVITTIIMGTYLTGLMIEMGADDDYISLCSALTSLCSIAQLVAPLLFERIRLRKKILIACRVAYQFMNIVLIGIIPILPIPKPLMLVLFIAVIITLNLINSLSVPGISIWLMQCIPENKHSDYFTTSALFCHIISAMSGVFAGHLLDNFKADGTTFGGLTPAMCAFLILRFIALLFCIFEIACMIRISEKPYQLVDKKRGVGLRLLFEPLKNGRYVKIIMIYILYSFTAGIVGEYFIIYLINIVKVPYTLFSYSLLTSLPFYFIMIPVFAKLVNKYTWMKILPFLIVGSGAAYIFNMLITLETQFYYHIVMIVYYMFAPSITVVFSYLPYTNMPGENRTSYISLFTISGIVAAFLGRLCGILFMNITDGFVLNIFGKEFVNYQYLNLLQFVLFTLTALYAAIIGKSFSKNKTKKCDVRRVA